MILSHLIFIYSKKICQKYEGEIRRGEKTDFLFQSKHMKDFFT
jgi:hypothetical protein